MSTEVNMSGQGNIAASALGSEDNYISCKYCHKLFKDRKFMEKHLRLKHPRKQDIPKSHKDMVLKHDLCQPSTTTGESYSQKTHNIVSEAMGFHTSEENGFTAKIKSEPEVDIKPIGSIYGLNVDEVIPEIKKEKDLNGVADDTNEFDIASNETQQGTDTNVNCIICNKIFASIQYLQKHYKLKHKIKEEPQTMVELMASEANSDVGNFNTHYKLKHKIKKEPQTKTELIGCKSNIGAIDCPICGEELENIAGYTKHVEKHIGANESESQQNVQHGIKTETPSNKIKAESYIKIGVTHKQTKSYSCTFCHKIFSTRWNATVHIKAVHLKMKKFPAQEINTEPYIKIHVSDQKQNFFTCTLCDKTCVSKWNAIKHINTIHFKRNQYPCTLCNESFYYHTQLQTHIDNDHKMETYS